MAFPENATGMNNFAIVFAPDTHRKYINTKLLT